MRQPAGGIFWEHLASCFLPPSSTTDLKVLLLVDVFHFTDLLSVCSLFVSLFVPFLFVCSFVCFFVCRICLSGHQCSVWFSAFPPIYMTI